MSEVWRPVVDGTVLVDGLAELRLDDNHLYFSFDGDELYVFDFTDRNRLCELAVAEQPVGVYRPVSDGVHPIADDWQITVTDDGRKFSENRVGATWLWPRHPLPPGWKICELVSAEQPVAPQPDWTLAPEWAKWYSMDKDGNDHWWRNKPILNDKYAWWLYDWDCGNTTYPHYIDVRRRPEEYGIDWRQTLQRRPEKAP